MKEAKKQFFRYDTWAEDKVKDKYGHIVRLVNTWAIPLMRIFGESVTLDNVREVVKNGVEAHFVDVLISRKIDDPKAFSAIVDYKPTAERLFNDSLAEVVKATDEYKAVDRMNASQEGKDWERARLVERGATRFANCVDTCNRFKARTLESALSNGIIVWGDDCVKFNDAKIKEDCALYVEGEEIAFVAGLENIAKAINEAYKGGLSDMRYITYLLDCKDGKAVLNRGKIDLVDLMQYGPVEI